jgi:hypothetical protein
MPRKGKGQKFSSKIISGASNYSGTECSVCGYPIEWKVHNHG